jgi:hypothetical protein
VRDDLRAYVVEHLGDPDAVLVVDETGDLKKGSHTVGVQRRYSGTAGRTENCQVAVYLAYATARAHALIDRALYLPRSWTCDPERMAAAGVPEDVEFATKPALATTLILRALDGGAPAGWVAGDEVYGADPKLRTALQARGVGYVLAVACSHPVPAPAGNQRADQIAAGLPRRAWQRLGRSGLERATSLRLGLDHHRRRSRPRRAILAADSPQHPHRRAGLLSLLGSPPGTAARTGARRGPQMDRGGVLPVRQGPGRPRPAPGPPLDLLGDAGPCWRYEHGDLVPQRQDLHVLGGVGAGEQRQPARHANQHQMDESEGHG